MKMQKQIIVPTTKVAAHVINQKFGDDFLIDNSIHKAFINCLLLPKRQAKDKNLGKVVFNTSMNLKYPEMSGQNLHDWVMQEMCIFLTAQTESGINISDAILNWMDKYELDDGILQIDTAKKYFYRFRKKEAENKEMQTFLKKVVENGINCSKNDADFVPSIFEKNLKAFLAFLKDFDHIVTVSCEVLKIDLDTLQSTHNSQVVYQKTIIANVLYYSLRLTLRDIATYFNISVALSYKYLKEFENNKKKYIVATYQIFKRLISIDNETAIILQSIE